MTGSRVRRTTGCRTGSAFVIVASLLAAASAATAGDVSISTSRTTPVESATGDGAGAGDVTVTAAGSVTTSSGPSVTLNSDNEVVNNGTIEVTNNTGAIAVLIEGGFNGSFTSAGTIDALVVDSNDVATGAGNIALWVSGGGAFVGSITLDEGSTTVAGGDGAVAFAIDTMVQGTITIDGTVNAQGPNATAFATTATIDGDLLIDYYGSVSATGENARAVVIGGEITGSFTNNETIAISGLQTNVDYGEDPDYPAADFALGIGASIGGGFLSSTTGNINVAYGATAVLISPELAASPADLTLGMIDATDTPYGFVNNGSINAYGYEQGIDVTGLILRGYDDGANIYAVFVEGGIQNTGSIGIASYADQAATSVLIGDGAQTPLLVNTGTIAAAGYGAETATAFGLLVESGGSLAAFDNSGSMTAAAYGDDAYAYTLVDLSGTLLSITNSGDMSATAVTYADVDDPGDDDIDGDVGDGFTEAVVIDLSRAAGATTITNSGTISGATRLGDQNDAVALINDGDDDDSTFSAWYGSIAFGGGDDTLSISGAGVFTGGTSKTSGTLAVAVQDGTLALGAADIVQATTVDLSSSAVLTIQVSPDNATVARIDAADTITIADGARIEATLADFVGDSFTAVLLQAAQIDSAIAASDLLIENIPFLYNGTSEFIDGAEDELLLHLQLKSAAELGLTARRAAFYDAVIDILNVDGNALAEPLLALDEGVDFNRAYDALMPMTAQATLRATMALAAATERAIETRTGALLVGDTRLDGVSGWWSGTARAITADADEHGQGIDGDLTAVTFGLEGMLAPWGSAGAALTFGASSMLDSMDAERRTRLDSASGTVYASFAAGPGYLAGSVGGGYISNRSDRLFETDAFSLEIEDAWDSTMTTAAAEAGLNVVLGKVTLRPSAGVSWLSFSEEAHAEDSGETGFDLAYDALDVDLARAKAGIFVGYEGGDRRGLVQPSLSLSWSELLGEPDATVTGRFVDGAVPFVLTTTPLARHEINATVGISIVTEGAVVSAKYDATVGDGELAHGAQLHISMLF